MTEMGWMGGCDRETRDKTEQNQMVEAIVKREKYKDEEQTKTQTNTIRFNDQEKRVEPRCKDTQTQC